MSLLASQRRVQSFSISHQEDSKTQQKSPAVEHLFKFPKFDYSNSMRETEICFIVNQLGASSQDFGAFSWIDDACIISPHARTLLPLEQIDRILQMTLSCVAAHRELCNRRRTDASLIPERRAAIVPILSQDVELQIHGCEPLLVVVEVARDPLQ